MQYGEWLPLNYMVLQPIAAGKTTSNQTYIILRLWSYKKYDLVGTDIIQKPSAAVFKITIFTIKMSNRMFQNVGTYLPHYISSHANLGT
jgi:hypothetical protein